MTKFVALWRGINVGKQNRVSMPELRRVLAESGFTDVATLLQSGNAVFSASGSVEAIATRIRAALAAEMGLAVPMIVRTAAQLAKAIDDDPFGSVATNPKTHLLGFFSDRPAAAAVRDLAEAVERRQAKGGKDSGDRYEIRGDHVHLWCPVNVHESIFATVDWTKILGVDVTMRNWDTVTKLLAMVS